MKLIILVDNHSKKVDTLIINNFLTKNAWMQTKLLSTPICLGYKLTNLPLLTLQSQTLTYLKMDLVLCFSFAFTFFNKIFIQNLKNIFMIENFKSETDIIKYITLLTYNICMWVICHKGNRQPIKRGKVKLLQLICMSTSK